MNNTPTLMQSEEERAPWNQKTKTIEVNISQCLSSTQTIEVPDDFEYDQEKLKEYVYDQVMLPSDSLEYEGYYDWYVDDFCVI
jgi:hypothetical protein